MNSHRVTSVDWLGVPIFAALLLLTFEAGAQVQRLGQPPVASFTWSPCPAYDAPVIFDASESRDADGEIVGYTWDFGDGTTSEGRIIEHEYSQDGTYIVSLRVVDNESLAHDLKQHIALDDTCRSGSR